MEKFSVHFGMGARRWALSCQYAFIGWSTLRRTTPIILVMSESFIKYTIFPNIYKMSASILKWIHRLFVNVLKLYSTESLKVEKNCGKIARIL